MNDRCSSWCDKVGDLCKFGTGGKRFYMTLDQYIRSVKPAPLQSVKSMALSAMVVECE